MATGASIVLLLSRKRKHLADRIWVLTPSSLGCSLGASTQQAYYGKHLMSKKPAILMFFANPILAQSVLHSKASWDRREKRKG